MIQIENLEKLGLKITWKTLKIGFDDCSAFGKLFYSEEIIDYAINEMNNCSDENIISLACENYKKTQSIMEYLILLSQEENSNYEIEFRKLRLIFVIDKLKEIEQNYLVDSNYINALIDMGDIWTDLQVFEKSPYYFYGVLNDISPTDYYCEENYLNMFESHKKWISSELSSLLLQQEGKN